MHLCLIQLRLLRGGEKTSESNIFYISFGTLIWVTIIPVKVESGLTGIFRTFRIIFEAVIFEKDESEHRDMSTLTTNFLLLVKFQ